MNNNSSITFPYASYEQGQQDSWKKVGGPAEAFRFMVNGYKQTIWRKSSNERRQDEVKLAMKLYKEHKAKHGEKADKQLGRS